MGNAPVVETQEFHDNYTLGKLLGKGSQGRVHICTDKHKGGDYAVKVIDRSAKSAWETYQREVNIARCANSRNIITVLEEFVDDGNCYVIMEKFAGHLRKGLKWVAKGKGGAPVLLGDDLLRVMCQATAAVQHLHRCSIVHRDVKAYNLLVDRLDLRDARCRVVLSDLGLARRLERGHYLSAQVGTRKYWGPELYYKKYWHVADVFSLGVLVFLASSATYPYSDEKETCDRDVFAEGVVPDGLPRVLRDFMRLCLEKDPMQRPTAEEAAAQLCRGEDSREPSHPNRTAAFGPRLRHRPRPPVPEPRGDEAKDIEMSSDSSSGAIDSRSVDAGHKARPASATGRRRKASDEEESAAATVSTAEAEA